MNTLQIVLVSVLVLLGTAFLGVLYVRFNENINPRRIIRKKKYNTILEIIKREESAQMQWDCIWSLFFKKGIIDYLQIYAILTKIINKEEDSIIKKRAIDLLKERTNLTIFGDIGLTNDVELFFRVIDKYDNQEIKEAGYKLVDQLKTYCKNKSNANKYDYIIQWIFNAMEIIGFVLAIISVKEM